MPSTQNSHLILEFGAIQTRFLKRIDGKLSIHGISFTEFLVMLKLDAAPHKRMRRIDLAASVGLSASGVTRLIAPMEKIKLVQKEQNPRDARVSLVKLSDVGQQLFNDALISFDECSEALMQPLDASQREQFLSLLTMLR